MSAPHLAFHAAGPSGEAYVLQVDPPTPDGRVAWREWEGDGFAEPPREIDSTAEELAERVRGWQRAGWSFTEPVPAILVWLGFRR